MRARARPFHFASQIHISSLYEGRKQLPRMSVQSASSSPPSSNKMRAPSLPCSLAPAFTLSMSVRPPERTLQSLLVQRRPPIATPLPNVPLPTRVQLARIRFHLLNSRAREAADSERRPDMERRSDAERRADTERRRNYSPAERRIRSERLKNLWNDPAWRERMLARRNEPEVLKKISDAAKANWNDPDFRERMRASRLGRTAPNKGQPASKATRLRMSLARKGVSMSKETRKKISQSRLNRAQEDDWPRLISQGKKGKTKEYFSMRREFRALHRDLMLWSDTYRTKYGRLPSASTYERFVAPMMIFRIKRYLMLKEAIGEDEPQARDIMSD
ncbi:hypothetical protein FGB62_92g032 [Gracilaria domingensis]|nr:hypothetical protein FGB62_92g032 [Gracilaria domingensis]